MDLEKELRQRPFQNEMEKAIVNILFTSSWIGYSELSVLKHHDLSMQQYNVLRILKGCYPAKASINYIIERMIDKTSNASRIVEKLRQKGLISRISCPKDRRQVEIEITPEGTDLLEKATDELHRLHIFHSALAPEEARQLNQLLDKIRNTKSN